MKNKYIILLIILIIIVITSLLFIKKNELNIINKIYNKDYLKINYPKTNRKILDNYINDYISKTISSHNETTNIYIDYDYHIENNNVFLTMYEYTVDDKVTTSETKNIIYNNNTNKLLEIKNELQETNYEIINSKNNKNKLIALTFDDGPSYVTSKILDILKKYNVTATFFIVGQNGEKYPNLIKKISDANMEIGNHTYSHIWMTKYKDKRILEEINKTDELVYSLTNKYPTLIRPSYGEFNNKIKKILNKPIILWNLDPKDWNCHSSKKIANRIINKAKHGSIILMHDIYTASANALEIFIPELLEKGYDIVSVSKLFYYQDKILEKGKSYYNAK